MRSYSRLILAPVGAMLLAPAAAGPNVAALQAEREKLQAQGKDLQDQIRAEQARRDELEEPIKEMGRRNARLDRDIRHAIGHRAPQGAAGNVPPAATSVPK